MDPKYWSKPVTYEEDGRGGYRTVTSTGEAARILLTRWPVSRGRRYRQARQICLDVLEGRRLPSEARRAFLDAAEEADVFVREQ